MKKEKIKVYLYTRVSTTMQIDGYSLDAQKTKMKAFCDYNEYEIAGMIEEGESVEDVARREAIEEAGLIVKRTKPVLSFLASPGGTSERSSIMVGEVDATTASGIHGLADENEDIRVHVVSREQAYQWVEEGKIDNAASVIALQWLQLHHQALKNEWA